MSSVIQCKLEEYACKHIMQKDLIFSLETSWCIVNLSKFTV